MKKIALFFCCTAWFVSALAYAEDREGKVIIMGYNESAKVPLIAESPENSGAYFDIYRRAADKIGYRLKIVRYPKKRVYLLMQRGEIDFYPGMKFNPERSEFAYFIPNGLPTGRTGISRSDLADITDLSQLEGKRVVMPLDGVDYTEGTDGIFITRVRKLDIQKAHQLLLKDRADFYATDDVVVVTYLKSLPAGDIKTHPNFLPSTMMTLGFSRNSPYYSAHENSAYDSAAGPRVDNDPWRLDPDSVVFRFRQALREMIEDGEIDAIYDGYFKLE